MNTKSSPGPGMRQKVLHELREFIVLSLYLAFFFCAVFSDGGKYGNIAFQKQSAVPSPNAMDNPVTNADGSTYIYFAPASLGDGKNWTRTLPDKGYFVILRLYGPTEPFFNQTWNPGDIEKVK